MTMVHNAANRRFTHDGASAPSSLLLAASLAYGVVSCGSNTLDGSGGIRDAAGAAGAAPLAGAAGRSAPNTDPGAAAGFDASGGASAGGDSGGRPADDAGSGGRVSPADHAGGQATTGGRASTEAPSTGGRNGDSHTGGTTSTAEGSGGGGSDTGGAASEGGAGAGPDTGDTSCRVDGDGLTTLVFVNRCAKPVTYRGSDIDGGELAPGAVSCVDIGTATETLSSKRYWGWVGSDPGAEHHTLAEFTFNTDFYDFDWYNISHVDAHNLPLQIVPVARPDCEVLTCAQSFLEDCPEEGRYTDSSGEVVACVSPDRDNPDSPVARYFESCDDAYAWSGDDQQGSEPSPMRACAGEDWDIVFCPDEEGS